MGAGHTHAHGHDGAGLRIGRGPRIAVVALIVASGLAALLGVWHWWPDEQRAHHVQGLVPVVAKGVTVVHAELTSVRTACDGKDVDTTLACGPSIATLLDCRAVGAHVAIDLTPDVIGTGLRPGDHVLLLDTAAVSGGQGDDYSFYRADRGGSMLWLAVLFAVLVVLVAWRRGLMALVSLGFAVAVVVAYLLPALLSGRPPIAVTVAAGALILIVMLFATHGISMRTAVAVVGALLGMGVSTAFAWLGVIGSRLAGLGDESAGLLTFNVPWISVQQLVVASVILAGLGTLNDVTITQVSALWELREASPSLSRLALFGRAMRIGRDHVASTVYTLVFAYLGTALVLLVAVQLYGGAPADLLTAENVAEEIVRTLVGGIALVLAMPITTAIGALVVAGAQPVAATPVEPVVRRERRRTTPPRVVPDHYRRLPEQPWEVD
ncbi:YibE/F family protein [Amnibacterium kyonggiense]|uniref:YibE/F-like protein n=1 Tax=Amnibacterium kyonggiense TaxID=595671 RepID=A0A4R7FT01_9MICO|nr:YibE/F family protein [Amnibacterium kyonggiense]TDS80819.1 YibE/F-like protein [Amnibacterium kyonggiense]